MANEVGKPRPVQATNVEVDKNIVERRRVVKQLPGILNTDLLKNFFEGTADSLFQPEISEKVSGFIGRVPSHADLKTDFYISEISKERQEHQLEPTLVSVDPDTDEITNIMFYDDLIDLLRFQGGPTNNINKLFNTQTYAWMPPINPDMLMNFTNYFWFPSGPDVIRFSEITNITAQFGSSAPVIIQGVELQDGDRVQFTQDIDPLINDRVFVVSGIGISFLLQTDAQLNQSVWDDVVVGWDDTPWDGLDDEILVSVETPDYIVMERGALDNNAWSKRNRWYHRNDLSTSQLTVALERQAVRPIIEFQRNIELFNHGIFGRGAVTVRDDVTTDPDVEILGLQNYTIDGIDVKNGDTILFTGLPTLQGRWDEQGWDFENPSAVGVDPLSPPHPQFGQVGFDWASGTFDPFFNISYSAPFGDIAITESAGQGVLITVTANFFGLGFTPGMSVTISGTDANDGIYTIFDIDVTGKIMTFVEPLIDSGNLGVNTVTIIQNTVIYQNRVFRVGGIGLPAGITLTLVADGQNSDGSPADGDQIKVLLGLIHQNKQYYWSDDDNFWVEAQNKLTTNQVPLFQLYDTLSNQLQDPGEYPLSDFAGGKIFSYQINSDPRQPLDDVLGIPLVFNEFGEIVFQNHLVTDRFNFNTPQEEIDGYYFYKILGGEDIDTFENAWNLKEVESRQFIVDSFVVTVPETNSFELSVEPTEFDTVQVFVNGIELTDNSWTFDENEIIFTNDFTVNDLVKIRYFSDNNIPEGVEAVYETPINLTANPDNLEIDFIANSDYFSHFTSVLANQPDLVGTPNGTNNWRNTLQDRSLGQDILQHRSPMLRVLTLGSSRDIDYMLSVRYVEREYSRFRNKFLRKIAEFFNDGIHTDTQNPSEWVEDALTSINLGKINDFPFSLSGMGVRENGEPTYYPSSPSRLGVYQVYKPEIYLDTTYTPARNVIQLHDGSTLIAYNDFRDEVILDFENNVFDIIPDAYKTEELPDFDWSEFVTTQFNSGDYTQEEFTSLLTPIIQRWAVFNNIDLTTNNIYSPTDPFTWNYSKQGVPGYWRGIYKLYYDTDRPNTHPWEMFGFSQKPDWWDARYGVAPYTSSNLFLWNDMLVGRIASGSRSGIHQRYARTSAPIPVNGAGDLLDPVALGITTQPGVNDARADWVIGDHGPGETTFRRNEMWPFAIAQISYLMKPAKFIELGWDANDTLYRYNNQPNIHWVNTLTEDRPLISELSVHGETLEDGTVVLSDGIQQWITNYVSSNGQSITNIFGNVMRNVRVQLAHKMGGFINSDANRVLADNFGLVPQENTAVLLYNSPSIKEELYSGVIIERVGTGWSVFGYDVLTPSFTMKLPVKTSRQLAIDVGTVRVLESTEYKDEIRVVPYGTIFPTRQELYDFLIGYGEYLKTRGWIFDNFDFVQNENNDWRLSGKQFLFWSQGNWDNGSLVTVSPLAEGIKFTTEQGIVSSIEQVINGVYSLLDRDGGVINPEDTFVVREGDVLTVTPTNDRFIFSARLFVSEYEHVIAFDNETIFNDLIYDPLLNLRQSRLKIFTTRAGGWTGKFDAPGYIITENTLTANYEKTANDFRRYFEIEEVVDRQAVQVTARRLIGFQTRDYLDNLNLSGNTQFQFYQGFVRQKGTRLVIDKLFRSDFTEEAGDIQIFEEWALRLGEFGSVQDAVMIEFLLREEEWRAEPQMIRFLADTTANNPDSPFDDILELSTDDERWVVRPPFDGIVRFPFRSPTAERRSRNAAYLFRTDVPIAGYALETEVTFHVETIEQRDAIFNTQKITVEAEDLAFGDLIWVDNIGQFYSINDPDNVNDDEPLSRFNHAFMVYRYTDTGLTFSLPVLPFAEEGTLIVADSDHGFQNEQIVMIDGDTGTTPDINASYIITLPTKVEGTPFATISNLIEGLFITIDGQRVDIICDTIDEIIDLINAANVPNVRAYNSGGQIVLTNIEGDDIVLAVGSPATVIGSVGGTHEIGHDIEINGVPVTFTTGTARVVGANDATYTVGKTIIINGTTVTLSTALGVVDSAIIDINAAVIAPAVTAFKDVSGLAIISNSDIVLTEEFTGTGAIPYTNGKTIVINGIIVTLSTGTTVADAVIDITAAAITGITASDVLGELRLSSTTVNITVAEGDDTALADLGFVPGFITALGDLGLIPGTFELQTTTDDAVTDITSAAILNIVAINDGNALRITDTATTLVIADGAADTALPDLGLVAGSFDNVLTEIGLTAGTFTTIATDSFVIQTSIGTDSNVGTHPGTIGVYTESRFADIAARDAAEINSVLGLITFADGDHVYVDTRVAIDELIPLWEVYVSDGIGGWTVATFDDALRTQTPRIDVELFKPSLLYNNDTNITDMNLAVFDPAKGLFPSQATAELTYRIEYDPAKYTNGDEEEFQIDPTFAWGDEEIGEVWWDMSAIEYLDYEHGSDRYRRNNWGKISPNKSMDIYEWVKSTVPPLEWATLVGEVSEDPEENFEYKPSGEAFMVDVSENPPYVQRIKTNDTTQEEEISYYFWVKNSETVPNVKNRNRSVALIARIMTNPTFEGIPWFAAIANDVVIVSGVEQLLTRNNSVLQINYNFMQTDVNLHREWVLSRDGDERDIPTDRFWNKMRDSLAGFDVNNDPVPDPNLEESRRYGNFIRPRQTWFIDREAATSILFDAFNGFIINQCIVDERTDIFNNLNNTSVLPTLYIGPDPILPCEYNFHVADEIERDALATNSIIALNEQVWVDGTPETLSFWKVYTFGGIDPVTLKPIYTETCSEAYKVSDFWDQIDFFADGFDSTTTIDLVVDTVAERDSLTNVTEGFIVRVNDSNSDSNNVWAWFQYNPQDNFNPWVLIAKQDCTIQFNTALFTDPTYGNVDVLTNLDGRDQALMEVLDAIRNDIATNLEQNKLFYTMVRYVFSEQSLIDWAFKTSYILAIGLNQSAEQKPVLVNDVTQNIIDFINEAKPYHTKLRDFVTNENFGIDLYAAHITDFDKPVHIDSVNGNRVLSPDNPIDVTIMSDEDSPQNDWFNNYILSPENIRTVNVQLLFDRVSCESSGGWDNLFGWDSGANENWDLLSADLNETAADRIIRLYQPQPLSIQDINAGNIDPVKNVTETKDIASLISGCNFKGTIMDGRGLVIDIDQIDTFLSGGGFDPAAPINPDDIIVDGNLFIQPGLDSDHPEELVLSRTGEAISICTTNAEMYEVVGADASSATYNNGESIIINGLEIFLTTGVFPAQAVVDIRNAANNAALNISASFDGTSMKIISTSPIVIAEGTIGTAGFDLGLAAPAVLLVDNEITPNIAFRLFLNNVNAQEAENITPFSLTTLDAPFLAGDTSLFVTDATGFPDSSTLIVGTIVSGIPQYEFIGYTSISSNEILGLTRDNPLNHNQGDFVIVLDITKPQIALWDSCRINDAASTTLAADFKIGDVEMEITNVVGLPKQKPSETYMTVPGVVWIEYEFVDGGGLIRKLSERIEYFQRDGTTLKYLRRGTSGTSSGIPAYHDIVGNLISDFRDASIGDVIYPAVLTRVIDTTLKQIIPGGYNWEPAPAGLQSSNSTQATFLKNGPGSC